MSKEFHLREDAIDRAAKRMYDGMAVNEAPWEKLPAHLKLSWLKAVDDIMTAALGEEYVVFTRHKLILIFDEVERMLDAAGALDEISRGRFIWMRGLLT